MRKRVINKMAQENKYVIKMTQKQLYTLHSWLKGIDEGLLTKDERSTLKAIDSAKMEYD